MKCHHCGGRLTGDLTVCPYCGVRTQVDFKVVNHRDLGDGRTSMPCPLCEDTSLKTIEFDTRPPVHVETCGTCHGIFFNPGELETVLSSETHPTVWMDTFRIDAIALEPGHRRLDFYRACPMCDDRMRRLNFGGRSGVIIDSCGLHGVWLDAGELNRLLGWWHAGGKHIHQAHELDKARALEELRRSAPPVFPASSGGTWSAGETSWDTTNSNLFLEALAIIGRLILDLAR